MAKKFKSHAQRISKVETFLSGIKAYQKEFSPVSKKAGQISAELSIYKQEDAKQEALKAELNLATQKVNKSAQKIDDLYRQLVDYAYSLFTKKGKELKKFGLEPWEKGGRRKSKNAK